MSDECYDVAVVGVDGAGHKLAEARIRTVAILPADEDLGGAVFDESAHTWTLPACRTRIVIANQTREGPTGLVPYLGVAVHGVPNYFTVTAAGPVADAQLRYILECLKLMRLTGSSRIEVRHSTQRTFHDRDRGMPARANVSYWRRMRKLAPAAFDLSSHIGVEDDVYDGLATLRIDADQHEARVRLTGHLDPIDGRYHWRGTVFEALADDELTQSVTLTVGERSAEGRITERTPWGTCSVAGVGAPPFAPVDQSPLDVTIC